MIFTVCAVNIHNICVSSQIFKILNFRVLDSDQVRLFQSFQIIETHFRYTFAAARDLIGGTFLYKLYPVPYSPTSHTSRVAPHWELLHYYAPPACYGVTG